MAKTPPQPDGYVQLSATIDESECRQCRNGIFKAIGEVDKTKVPWLTFTVVLSLCVIFFAIVGVMAKDNTARGIRTETQVEALKDTLKDVKDVLKGQAAAFEALRMEIRSNGK